MGWKLSQRSCSFGTHGRIQSGLDLMIFERTGMESEPWGLNFGTHCKNFILPRYIKFGKIYDLPPMTSATSNVHILWLISYDINLHQVYILISFTSNGIDSKKKKGFVVIIDHVQDFNIKAWVFHELKKKKKREDLWKEKSSNPRSPAQPLYYQ